MEPLAEKYERAPVEPRGRVTLFRDRAVVLDASGDWIDQDVALAALEFDYGVFAVSASDARSGVFVAADGGTSFGARDCEAENEIRQVLEGFGLVDLECLDRLAVSPGSPATYLVCYEGDVHDFCDFETRVIPELEAKGISVVFDDDYPWRVVARDPALYASLDTAGDRPDWFALELGVELDGQRVNLVPALLSLLEGTSAQSFRALSRRPLREIALPVGARRWVTVPKDKLGVILEVVVELHQGGVRSRELLSFGPLSAHALERLPAGVKRRTSRPAVGAPPKPPPRPPKRRRSTRPVGWPRRCVRIRRRDWPGSRASRDEVSVVSSRTTWGSARRSRRSPTS